MIEPTETESKQTLDEFVQVMKAIAKEAATDPRIGAQRTPHTTVVGRLDEVKAARHLVLRREK